MAGYLAKHRDELTLYYHRLFWADTKQNDCVPLILNIIYLLHGAEYYLKS
jgi:hypothetical protein